MTEHSCDTRSGLLTHHWPFLGSPPSPPAVCLESDAYIGKGAEEMMDMFWSAARDVPSERSGQELPYSGFHRTQAVSGLQSD